MCGRFCLRFHREGEKRWGLTPGLAPFREGFVVLLSVLLSSDSWPFLNKPSSSHGQGLDSTLQFPSGSGLWSPAGSSTQGAGRFLHISAPEVWSGLSIRPLTLVGGGEEDIPSPLSWKGEGGPKFD